MVEGADTLSARRGGGKRAGCLLALFNFFEGAPRAERKSQIDGTMFARECRKT